VVFQPTCPVKADLSDAGLQPGSVAHAISVPGKSDGAANTVRSTSGAKLEQSQNRRFTTPASDDPADVFIDTVSGPPVPLVRALGSSEPNATYLEIGGDDAKRVYFEFDDVSQTYSVSDPDDLDGDGSLTAFEVPLNLFSDPNARVAVMLFFNQSVSPGESNVTQDLLRIEFLNSDLEWQPIDTRVTLVANCTEAGSLVRLEPIGILPAHSMFRAVVRPGFRDLVGQTNLLTIDRFARAPTRTVLFDSLDPRDDLGDELLEEFTLSHGDPGSFEDGDALFESPAAIWEGGELRPAFEFVGTGGPDGDFDWYIKSGDNFFFDTTATAIVGGPGGVPTTVQNTVNGIVDVRDLVIEEDGILRVQGPNTMQINASRNVIIRGEINISGFNAKDVSTLNTGHQPESGGAGAGGGGKGGIGSWVTTGSTPFGGPAWGAFGVAKEGGGGGHTGYSPSGIKNDRRPGGGGGGTLAGSQVHYVDGEFAGAETLATGGGPGTTSDGNPLSQDATRFGAMPAWGGAPGPGPFQDDDPTNDFAGVHPVDQGGTFEFVRGELPRIHAGAGGGAGGDACPAGSFPTPGWTIASDEKGGGGGGGAGGLNVRALGNIVFGEQGRIRCDGGRGGAGENTMNFDHIGGTGGSGSGGHVILETASNIDFTDGGTNPPPPPGFYHITAEGGPTVTGNLQFGQVNTSYGGAGGPGIIQLHVPDPLAPPGPMPELTDIVVHVATASKDAPLHAIARPAALVMVPLFGARSKARSRWISVGGAAQDPDGAPSMLAWRFDGTDLLDGQIETTDGKVDELDPLLGEVITGSAVSVETDGVTLRIEGSSLDPLIAGGFVDIYLRAPNLLRSFLLRLELASDPLGTYQDFLVTAAAYDDLAVALTITVDGGEGTLQAFIDEQAGGAVQYELIPRFFRVYTDGEADVLPGTAAVRITFDAARADVFGNPDESDLLVEDSADITDFHDPALVDPGELQFFRFNVVFDLDALGIGLTSETESDVSVDFLRIPFRF